MPIPKLDDAINDFSAGELDPDIKRSGSPLIKMGGRQMVNWRVLNSHKKANRPGRTLVAVLGQPTFSRIEEFAIGANVFAVGFAPGKIGIINASGTIVFLSAVKGDGTTAIPWTAATLATITWTIIGNAIYIAYPDGAPNNVPQVLTWDGVSQTSTWTLSTYAETVFTSNQKRTPFYRLSPQNITMQPSATTGSVSITFSSSVLVAGHVGTRMRYANRQLLITAVTSGTLGTATVEETLPISQAVAVATSSGAFLVGDVVKGSVTGAEGIVTAGLPSLVVQLIANTSGVTIPFTTADTIAGPNGTCTITSLATGAPQAIGLWDDEVINAFRGYPRSVFSDQSRLGFTNFTVLRGAILWSAVNLPADLYVDAQPDDAMLELAPDQSVVFYVVPGMESSEFVFTDRAIYYIPINVNNPLRPGSVAFNKLSDYGCMPNVQPRRAEQTIVYMKAGGASVGAVQAPGAYYRPYIVDSISEMHSHLFTGASAVAIAIPQGQTQFEELYIYILLANGTLVVGRYIMRNGLLEPGPEGKPNIGWLPWNGAGSVNYISSALGGGLVLLTTNYMPNGITPVNFLEYIDANQYLDAGVGVNNPVIGLQAGQPARSSLVGNMTGDGGLAAAFNGTRVQGAAASAEIGSSDGYVGEQFTTAQTVGQALVWPTSDGGFAAGGTGGILIELRAKQTAPTSSTDGTSLADVILNANQTTGPVVLTPAYNTTLWAYAWIHISQSGATGLGIAQVIFQTGPLWFWANGSVTLIDNGTRFMGTYNVDANGNIVPQFIGGENLASPNLIAGQPWTAVFEPFLPHAPGGADQQQRMRRRKVSKGLVSVENSTGFVFGTRRIPYYFVGEDATQPAPLREKSYQIRPRGRSYDPRLVLTKDTPGPLTVVEYGFEVTV